MYSEVPNRQNIVAVGKRPFLRKNQGRAAWCSRLAPSSRKMNTFTVPGTSMTSCLMPVQKQSQNSTTRDNASVGLDHEMFKNAYGQRSKPHLRTVKFDTSTGNSGDVLNHSAFTLADEVKGTLTMDEECKESITCEDIELEEFENLERFINAHVSNLPNQVETKRNPISIQSSLSGDTASTVRTPISLPVIEEDISCSMDNQQPNDENVIEKNASTENILSQVNSTCPDFAENLPWRGEAEVGLSAGGRFNIARGCNEPHSENKDSVVDPADPSHSAIKIWIERLEAEVHRFNVENSALLKLKAEKEKALSILAKEKKEFEKYRSNALSEIETLRQGEMNKLKKERKILADYQRSLHTMPQRRDREEIERLRHQICDEKSEAAQREMRLQHQLNRQRMRIEELTAEKKELLERVKRLEQSRLMLQNTISDERDNRMLKISNQKYKISDQNRTNSFSQCPPYRLPTGASNGHSENEVQKRGSVVVGTNPKWPITMPSERLPSECTAVSLTRESLVGSPKSLPLGLAPPTNVARPLREQKLRKSSGASDCWAGEDSSSSVKYFRSNGASNRTCEAVTAEVYRTDSCIYEHQIAEATPAIAHAGVDGGSLSCPSLSPFTVAHPVVVEESHAPGGITVQIFSNGDKIISLPNGQKEFHCMEFKRRIYPAGTIKTVFSDGRQETRYASGRIRVKDREGNLIVDTRLAALSQKAATELSPLHMPPHLVSQ